jgi:tetratricopeptide (TPR) repeat protein
MFKILSRTALILFIINLLFHNASFSSDKEKEKELPTHISYSQLPHESTLFADALKGKSDAQFQMGEIGYNIWKEDRSKEAYDEAVRWLTKAANQQHEYAKELLKDLERVPFHTDFRPTLSLSRNDSQAIYFSNTATITTPDRFVLHGHKASYTQDNLNQLDFFNTLFSHNMHVNHLTCKIAVLLTLNNNEQKIHESNIFVKEDVRQGKTFYRFSIKNRINDDKKFLYADFVSQPLFSLEYEENSKKLGLKEFLHSNGYFPLSQMELPYTYSSNHSEQLALFTLGYNRRLFYDLLSQESNPKEYEINGFVIYLRSTLDACDECNKFFPKLISSLRKFLHKDLKTRNYNLGYKGIETPVYTFFYSTRPYTKSSLCTYVINKNYTIPSYQCRASYEEETVSYEKRGGYQFQFQFDPTMIEWKPEIQADSNHIYYHVSLLGKTAVGHAQSGMYLYKAGDIQEALQEFDFAIYKDINERKLNAFHYANAGLIYFLEGQHEKAKDIIKKARDANATKIKPFSYVSIGTFFAVYNQEKMKAVKYFKRYIDSERSKRKVGIYYRPRSYLDNTLNLMQTILEETHAENDYIEWVEKERRRESLSDIELLFESLN